MNTCIFPSWSGLRGEQQGNVFHLFYRLLTAWFGEQAGGFSLLTSISRMLPLGSIHIPWGCGSRAGEALPRAVGQCSLCFPRPGTNWCSKWAVGFVSLLHSFPRMLYKRERSSGGEDSPSVSQTWASPCFPQTEITLKPGSREMGWLQAENMLYSFFFFPQKPCIAVAISSKFLPLEMNAYSWTLTTHELNYSLKYCNKWFSAHGSSCSIVAMYSFNWIMS